MPLHNMSQIAFKGNLSVEQQAKILRIMLQRGDIAITPEEFMQLDKVSDRPVQCLVTPHEIVLSNT